MNYEPPTSLRKDQLNCIINDSLQGTLDLTKKIPLLHPLSNFLSCTDPRSEYAVLATPGGDMGEFIII